MGVAVNQPWHHGQFMAVNCLDRVIAYPLWTDVGAALDNFVVLDQHGPILFWRRTRPVDELATHEKQRGPLGDPKSFVRTSADIRLGVQAGNRASSAST